MNESITLDTPDQINAFRILRLKGALKLETKGMRMSRGRTAYSLVKEEFGFKGSKQKVLDQLQRYIWDNLLRINECAAYSEDLGRWVYVRRGETGYYEWEDVDTDMLPQEFNELAKATDKGQREDMLSQSMFGWRT